jgi:hypothetical protein
MVAPWLPVRAPRHRVVQLGRIGGLLLIPLPERRFHRRRLPRLRQGVVRLSGMRRGVVVLLVLLAMPDTKQQPGRAGIPRPSRTAPRVLL